jgi:hypothetical protein
MAASDGKKSCGKLDMSLCRRIARCQCNIDGICDHTRVGGMQTCLLIVYRRRCTFLGHNLRNRIFIKTSEGPSRKERVVPRSSTGRPNKEGIPEIFRSYCLIGPFCVREGTCM